MNRLLISASLLAMAVSGYAAAPTYKTLPEKGADNVNPDTRLTIIFESEPTIGTSGMIRIYDAETDAVVDSLDMSIPAGPTERTTLPKAPYTLTPYLYDGPRLTNADIPAGTPSGTAARDTSRYQLNIIGGFTDGFHFYPVIVHGNRAEIYPHNNLLQCGREYYVTVDPQVLATSKGKFKGISKKDGWKFSTRSERPDLLKTRHIIVAADGSGDFNTVQGAIDQVPDNSTEPYSIFIKDGDYEEIVYFRNKSNLTIEGQSREGVYVHYANNEVFNPHPADVSTNEWLGTFPSRRGAFTVDHCTDVTLKNFTVATTVTGQAEGLLVNGNRTRLEDLTILGSGDALQANGPTYLLNCRIEGHGDTVLGRGPCFFQSCTLVSRGPFAWIRNTSANHGDVFVDCTFIDDGAGTSVFARTNSQYPNCEFVMIDCRVDGVSPKGWSGLDRFDPTYVHYWEYNTTNLKDGTPADVSQRAAGSRQLTMPADSALIEAYRNPAWVLGGWDPR